MNLHTFTVSHTLETIQVACATMEHDGIERRLQIAIATLRTLGTLTEEYPPEYFMDEEIDYIAEATLYCLDNILHTQGETE
tara:strand:- start:159 stop:401 length:243 start_codon:yes stop_codon:yes gene_type:complete